MPLDFTKLTKISYLTEQPPTGMAYFWLLIVALAGALLSALVCWHLARRRPSKDTPSYKILIFLARWLSLPSVLGLILLFFRNQGIMYLSWRLWLVVFGVIWLGVIAAIIYRIIFIFPKTSKEYELRQIKQKYIPQPKKPGGRIGNKNS